jgi:hypothetical protein
MLSLCTPTSPAYWNNAPGDLIERNAFVFLRLIVPTIITGLPDEHWVLRPTDHVMSPISTNANETFRSWTDSWCRKVLQFPVSVNRPSFVDDTINSLDVWIFGTVFQSITDTLARKNSFNAMMTLGMKENLGIVRHNAFVSFSSREKELMLFNACLLYHSLEISIFALSSLHLTPGYMIVDLIPVNQSCIVRDHVMYSFDSWRSRIPCVDNLIALMNIKGIGGPKSSQPPLSHWISKLSQGNYCYLQKHQWLIISYIHGLRWTATRDEKKIILIIMTLRQRHVSDWKIGTKIRH